jgi:hypothetical protein
MASHVERLIDFLERCMTNQDLPKVLLEDVEWAVEVISANKLYAGNLDSINFNKERPEIKAWIDQINLKQIPVNVEENERLKKYEELHKMQN